MDMGGKSSTENACKISMLWNWYTIDSCFIAKSWHVKSRGAFAGSCIGVFFLVFAHQWMIRVEKEYNISLSLKRSKIASIKDVNTKISNEDTSLLENKSIYSNIGKTLSHKWWFDGLASADNIDFFEHLITCALFTVNWGVSYIIMLLFMYYNGYIIISCLLGAFFGRLFFFYQGGDPAAIEENAGCCC